MIFRQFLHTDPVAISYFGGCGTHAAAAVVDPIGEIAPYLRVAEDAGTRIRYVVDTHLHADHISAGRALAETAGAEYVLFAESAVTFPFKGVRDGDVLELGNTLMKVLHTPGHTPGGCCLYIEAEKKVITGDTLFADSIGRSDLPGGSHEQLLESIRTKLFPLPDDVLVYPGHGPETSIGHEKRYNPYF